MDEPRIPLLIYLVSLVIFGTNGVLAVSIESLDSRQVVLVRAALGTALQFVFYILAYRGYREHHERRQWAYMFLSGIFMGVMWMAQYTAYAEIGIGQSSLIYCLGPVLVLVMASIIFKDRLTANRIVGLALVLLGSMALSIYGLGGGGSVIGYACAVVSAVSYACLVIFNKMATKIVGLEASVIQIGSALLTAFLFLLITGGLPTYIASEDIPAILVLGLVNAGLGCLMYFAAIKRLSAPTVAICDYIEPLASLVLAAIILSEPFGPMDLLGTMLIMSGALMAVAGAKWFRRRRKEGSPQ